jgi:hypothetical protein
MCLDKESQTGLYDGFLSSSTAASHCLIDQLVVDFNIRPHRENL